MLMNADVAFDPSIVRDLSEIQYSAVCVDVGKYAEESMKVILDSGRLTSISKTVPPDEALGVSIDVYRFSGSETDVLLSEAAKIIEQDGNRNEWTELAMDRLMSAGTLNMRAFDIGGRAWYEIDNMEDLHQAEALFGRTEFDWESVDVAFVDMDGTLFNGNLPITGADRFFKQLTKRVQNVFLLSNNSSKTHAEYVSRLAKMGISADEKQILLSSDALIAFLKSKGVNRVYTVGTASFIGLLAALGINNTGDSPEAVVLGYDTELTYEKLQKAALLLHNLEMPYYATHLDVVCPTESGDIPDIGAMTKLIEATTERLPDITFGKPSHGMVEHVYKRLGIEPQNSVFFGDRVYTDYELANACGARFIGLLSGDAERADFEKCRNITVFGSVAEVFAE
jgi:HAD superfamily hydrolase (TIGR01450 family)